MAKKAASKKAPPKKKLAPLSADDSPVIIDGGGSTRLKQEGTEPGFSNGTKTVRFPELTGGIDVLAVKFDGGKVHDRAFNPQKMAIHTSAGASLTVTPVAATAFDPAHTDITFNTTNVKDNKDNATQQHTYVGDDNGDIRKIVFAVDGTKNIPKTVSQTTVRLRFI